MKKKRKEEIVMKLRMKTGSHVSYTIQHACFGAVNSNRSLKGGYSPIEVKRENPCLLNKMAALDQ